MLCMSIMCLHIENLKFIDAVLYMKSYYCCVFLIIYFKTIFMYPDAV